MKVKRCFDKGEVSTFIIDLKSVEMELKQEREVVISRCSCGK